MYQVKIENTVETFRKVTVPVGEQLVDENGNLMETQSAEDVEIQDVDDFGNPKVDENGDPVMVLTNIPAVDENGDPVMEPVLNDTGSESVIPIQKTAQEIADEEQVLIDTKTTEVQTKVDAYIAAQEYQRQNGGPGPSAEVEITKIVHEYDGQFEVVFREE